MKFALLLTAAAAGLLVYAQTSIAQERPSSEELVDFFSQSIDLGAKKGLCIGTEQECAEAQKPKGRDMLVNFELGSAELTAETKESLRVYVQAMNDDRLATVNFAVEGHTDGRGTEAYNEALSQERATAVRQFLIYSGVAPSRLTAIGLGERYPRTADVYDPQNRRVEMRVNIQ